MVSWGHFSPQVAQHAMMLFEGDLELHTDGLLDLGLVNSVSKCGNHGMDMGRHGARDFWGIFSKDIHITPTPFSVPLQTRGREDLYNSFCDINKVDISNVPNAIEMCWSRAPDSGFCCCHCMMHACHCTFEFAGALWHLATECCGLSTGIDIADLNCNVNCIV